MKIGNLSKAFDNADAEKDKEIKNDEQDNSMESFLEKVVEDGCKYTSDGSVGQTLVKKKAKRPLLLVSAMCAEEIKYIKSLEQNIDLDNINDDSLIEVCYMVESGAKPICKLPFTFETVMAIKSYRDMDMSILYNGRRELTVEAIMNLP